MNRLDPADRAREHARGGRLGDVDDQRARPRRRHERSCRVLDELIAERGVRLGRPAEGPERDERGRCVDVEVQDEGIRRRSQPLADAGVRDDMHPRPRPLERAPEAERLERHGDAPNVSSVAGDEDRVGRRVAKRLRDLDERAPVVGRDGEDGVKRRRERDAGKKETVPRVPPVDQRHTKVPREADDARLDRGLWLPGRDGHRAEAVVRAAAATKASKMRRASGETSAVRSGCHWTPRTQR